MKCCRPIIHQTDCQNALIVGIVFKYLENYILYHSKDNKYNNEDDLFDNIKQFKSNQVMQIFTDILDEINNKLKYENNNILLSEIFNNFSIQIQV